MRISFSRKGDHRGRHIVLSCAFEEAHDVLRTVTDEVLRSEDGRRLKPVYDRDEMGNTYFRFATKWMDRLMLVFPEAELSKGILTVLAREEAERLKNLPMPDYEFRGFKGEFWGDFQAQGAHQIVEGEIDFLNDEMGLGKTFQFLAALSEIIHRSDSPEDYRALLVVPNNTKYTWAEVLSEFFPDLSYVVIDSTLQSFAEKQRLIESGVQVTIVNTEAIRARPVHVEGDKRRPIIGWTFANPALFVKGAEGQQEWFAKDSRNLHGKLDGGKRMKWDFVCVDEHHRMKTPNAQVTYGFLGLSGRRWLLMSGTPVLNRPEEIWTCLHKLYPDTFNSFEAFCNALKPATKGKKKSKVKTYNPEAMTELRGFLHEISLRRRKDQVRDDLPEVVNIVQKVELSPEQREIYREVKEDFLLRLENGEIKSIAGMLPQITRLKQAAFSPELYGGSRRSTKIERLREIVQELVDSGEKAIIFSQWSGATRIIQRELADFNPAYVTGEVKSLVDRQEQIRKFRTDPDCKLYIGTIGANREGVNLGTATYVIFTDLDWVPAGKDQAVGRSAAGGLRGVHLQGQDIKVHVIEIQAEDTIEEWIQELLEGKRAVFSRMVERDGGRSTVTFDVENVLKMLRAEGLGKSRTSD